MTEASEAQVLVLLAQFVESRTGLHHPGQLLALKLVEHARRQGFASQLDYYYALRYDDPSSERMDALVDLLITGETYFHRELSGLERIVDHVAERARRGLSSRIWSAACATGEEPLSLAVLLAERGLLERTEIVASDISRRQIARAQSGTYTLRALRSCPDGMPPWLRVERGSPVVDARIRDRIDWRVVNLVEDPLVRALGTFDVVLCRNVLIYFEDETISRVATSLAGALTVDGILLIGASESLARLHTPLASIEREGTVLYERAVR